MFTRRNFCEHRGRRYGDLLLKYRPDGIGELLDVGSAGGFIQAGLESAGWSTTGLEPNSTMVENARDKLGLKTIQGTLEQSPEMSPFDAVCLIQVIEHFNDLPKAMQSLSALTKTGGLCLVEYWRRDSGIARILGPCWHEYSPPSVLHWFSRQSLDKRMSTFGFVFLDRGAPKKYITLGHASSLLSHKIADSPGGRQTTAALRLLPKSATFRYPTWDLEWRLYEKADG